MVADYTIPIFKFAGVDWRAIDYDASWVATARNQQVVEATPNLSNHPEDLRGVDLLSMGYARYEGAFGHRELSLQWSWINWDSEIRVRLEGIKARGRKPYSREVIIPCMVARTAKEAVLYVYPWLAKGEGRIEYDLSPFASITVSDDGANPYVRYEPHLLVSAVLAWLGLDLKPSARLLFDGKWHRLRLVEEFTEDGRWYGWYRQRRDGRLEDIEMCFAGRNPLDAWQRLLAVYAGHPIE